jgi:EAP30/Vps36 family
MTVQNINELTSQLASFQSSLQQFALHHADEIRSNPSFRSEFARMCTAIGVDPLVGSHGKKTRGWGLLGVRDFWIKVGVRVVGICRSTRSENGGIISVLEVKEVLAKEDAEMRRRGSSGSGETKGFVEITEYERFLRDLILMVEMILFGALLL